MEKIARGVYKNLGLIKPNCFVDCPIGGCHLVGAYISSLITDDRTNFNRIQGIKLVVKQSQNIQSISPSTNLLETTSICSLEANIDAVEKQELEFRIIERAKRLTDNGICLVRLATKQEYENQAKSA